MGTQNRRPIFTDDGRFASVLVTAANTSSLGGGTIATDIFLLLTADATNGTLVEAVRFIACASTPAATTATVGRVFVSSQAAGATTSANTWLIGEVSLPATNADSATVGVNPYDVPVGFIIPAGMSLLVTNHAGPAANTNWRADAIGAGDY